jgi:hypothetical protein
MQNCFPSQAVKTKNEEENKSHFQIKENYISRSCLEKCYCLLLISFLFSGNIDSLAFSSNKSRLVIPNTSVVS